MNLSINKNFKYPFITMLIVLLSLFLYAENRAYSINDHLGSPKSDEEKTSLPDDKSISYFIQTELILEDGVNWNNVDVETNDGVVTLTGDVNNILAKDRAVNISKAVKGVRAVVDNLNVRSLNISDADLKHNVEKALMLDPATDSYEVTVEANDGVISLSGKVDSWQEKTLSDLVARSVKGVTAVENNIYFEYDPNRSDVEIKNDIEQSLNWDIRVDDGLINVDVKNGNVELTGVVGSAAEQSQALINAWVAGVNEVSTDNLIISRWARDDELRKNKYVHRTDENIKKAIKDAFLYDPRVLSFNPDVNVKNGKVTLTGYVDNLKAKNAAERDAKNVVGVRKVENLLKVRADNFPKDMKIRTDVSEALDLNPYVESKDISVLVINGEVTLRGNVNNYQEKFEAQEAASTVYGVTEVNNMLEANVKSTPYAYDYYHQFYYPFKNRFNYSPVKSDAEIKEDIESQIYWSPFVNSSDVNVAVDKGTAVLTGQVDSWNEYHFAEKNAFDGGAITVDNDLEVEVR